jgi:hypothetical protein
MQQEDVGYNIAIHFDKDRYYPDREGADVSG